MHEYMRRIKLAVDKGFLDSVKQEALMNAAVAHDNYCAFHKGRDCNCDPDITVVNDGAIIHIQKDGSLKKGAVN
jgi:hypothetical protein